MENHFPAFPNESVASDVSKFAQTSADIVHYSIQRSDYLLSILCVQGVSQAPSSKTSRRGPWSTQSGDGIWETL